MSKFTSDETLDKWFAHHAPSNDEIILAHETIRMRFRQLAQVLNDLLPEVPDKTVALRALRDAHVPRKRVCGRGAASLSFMIAGNIWNG